MAKLLAEKQKRENSPLFKYTPDESPDRNQLSFHQSTARYSIIFGGNQSGKSVASAYEVAATATNKHRWKEIKGPKEIYVIAPEYRILYVGVYRHLKPDGDEKSMRFLSKSLIKDVGPRIPGAPVPMPSYIQVFCDFDAEGNPASQCKERPYSTIWFISADGGEEARKKIQAAAIDLAIIDEEVEQSIWEELQMRFLAKDGRCCISCTLVRSEEWLLDLEERADRKDPMVFVARLNTETSKHLSEVAKKEILGSLSEEMREVRVFGRSRRQHGLVFNRFTKDHIYQPGKDPYPEGCKIIAANDPGFRVHASLWCAVDDTTKTLYFYRELYSKSHTLFETCEKIAELEGYRLVKEEEVDSYTVFRRVPSNAFNPSKPPELVDERLIDPAQLRNLEDGRQSVAAQMISFYDTLVMPANNDIQGGIEAVQLLLQTNPLTGRPHIQVSSELDNFHSEIRRYRFKTDTSSRNSHATRIEPIRKSNHLMDCFRYICLHVVSTYGAYYKQSGGRGHTPYNQGINIAATTSLADRLEKEAQRLRNVSYNKVSHPYLGSEF